MFANFIFYWIREFLLPAFYDRLCMQKGASVYQHWEIVQKFPAHRASRVLFLISRDCGRDSRVCDGGATFCPICVTVLVVYACAANPVNDNGPNLLQLLSALQFRSRVTSKLCF